LAGDESETDVYKDDKSIDDNTLLYRRILNQPDPPAKQIVWDANKGCWRPSSIAFTDHKNGSPMSIAIGDTLKQNNLEPESILEGHENFSLVSFPAKAARGEARGVMRKPLENDPAHGEVFGKKTRGFKKVLVNASKWCVEPDLENPDQ